MSLSVKERLIVEEQELRERAVKLQAFLDKPDAGDVVGRLQHGLMIAQLGAMGAYLSLLALRIEALE